MSIAMAVKPSIGTRSSEKITALAPCSPFSVTEQLMLVRSRIATAGAATFRTLSRDCAHTLEVVARFLALLELYRQQLVTFDQVTPLGELHVRWTGGTAPADRHSDDVDGAVEDPDDGTTALDEEYT